MTIGKFNIPSWLASVIFTGLLAVTATVCADVLRTQRTHASRLSVEEIRSIEVIRRLERIDGKLDRLLDLNR